MCDGANLHFADGGVAIPPSMADGAASPRSKRMLLIVLGSIAGLVIVVGVGGYLALRHFGPDLRATGVAIEREATEFAKTHTAQECITEALARETRDADFMGGVKAKLFLKYCLGKTERPAGFCDGVPHDGDIMPTVKWTLAACASHGKPGDETCGRTMQSVIEVCSGK
jgi:hypothetical protein